MALFLVTLLFEFLLKPSEIISVATGDLIQLSAIVLYFWVRLIDVVGKIHNSMSFGFVT